MIAGGSYVEPYQFLKKIDLQFVLLPQDPPPSDGFENIASEEAADDPMKGSDNGSASADDSMKDNNSGSAAADDQN